MCTCVCGKSISMYVYRTQKEKHVQFGNNIYQYKGGKKVKRKCIYTSLVHLIYEK